MKKRMVFLIGALVIAALAAPAGAQDMTPSVTVPDQFVTENVLIESAVSDGPGFVVIHVDDGSGAPGPVAGFAAVADGMNSNIWIAIDTSIATPLMFAMLHVDDGAVGEYEFDGVSGLDNPVAVDGQVVTPSFNAAVISVDDQLAVNNTVTIQSLAIPVDGWIVIHSDSDGAPGPVLGQTAVSAGTSADVSVSLSSTTNTLWPMLHVDDSTIGTYEFDGASGFDNPIVINGEVAVTSFSSVPNVKAEPQIILPGDGMEAGGDMSFRADSVLSEGAGWLVIHAEADGAPGPVLGQTAVVGGLNEDIEVALSGDVTPVVWPMLHVDDGAVGTYEFDGASGLDNPVSVDGEVVTFPVAIAPSQSFTDQPLGGGDTLTIAEALIDAPGWLVIHAEADGAPGPVLGQTFIPAGLSRNIVVPVDAAGVGEQVFPMLHYDTAAPGVYEFGTVNNADQPVAVNGNVVVGPMAILPAEAPEMTEAPVTAACTVAPSGAQNINIRAEASTDSTVQGTLAVGQTVGADGQASAGGFTWYHLASGGWVRADVVTATGDCGSLATMEATG